MSAERFSPASLATTLGVSESTVKRWIDRGVLRAARTAGGHRKVALADVVAFLRGRGDAVPTSETLELLVGHCRMPEATTLTAERLAELLISGDTDAARAVVLAQYAGGRRVEDILDQLVGPAMAHVGERWSCDDIGIYEEHLATQRCWRVLTELRRLMPTPPATAPLALGGAPEGDPYVLPTLMAELTLREMHWRTLNLGAHVPATSLRDAIARHQPRLVWVSITSTALAPAFFADYPLAYETARQRGAAMVLGGQGLSQDLSKTLLATAFGVRLAHLKALAQALDQDRRPHDRRMRLRAIQA